VLNASADTIIDLQLQYDGTPQPLEVWLWMAFRPALRTAASRGKSITETDILLAPAARAEFIVTGTFRQASKRNLDDAEYRYGSGRRQ
jgi:hypothetical protein